MWPEDETILHPAHEYLNELDGSNAMRLIDINAKTVMIYQNGSVALPLIRRIGSPPGELKGIRYVGH